MMSRFPGEKLKKKYPVKLKKSYFIFFQVIALYIFMPPILKTCNEYISTTFIASSFKLGQLIEDDE